MRITCTYCGSRDVSEFSYLGDATLTRPAGGEGPAMHDYVYLRDNPAGPIREHWFHRAGCHGWVTVVRDTRTHAIESVVPVEATVAAEAVVAAEAAVAVEAEGGAR